MFNIFNLNKVRRINKQQGVKYNIYKLDEKGKPIGLLGTANTLEEAESIVEFDKIRFGWVGRIEKL